MNSFVALDRFYLQYVSGLLTKKDLEGLIFREIRDAPERFGLFRLNNADCDDYLIWLYPRISRAISGYRDQGRSFNNYISALVRMTIKEYRSRQVDSYVAEHAAWTAWYSYECMPKTEAQFADSEFTNSEFNDSQFADYRYIDNLSTGLLTELNSNVEAIPSKTGRKKFRNPRQLLILIMKCYHYLSDDFLERIAPLAGIETETLKKIIGQVRDMRRSRDEKIGFVRERVYMQFYRCIVYEKRLTVMPENSAASHNMKIKLKKAQQRLALMRKRLVGMRPAPSNSQIAKILGLSKGTVDASLHALKKRWNNTEKKPILQPC